MELSPYSVMIGAFFLLYSFVLAEENQSNSTSQCFCSSREERRYACYCTPQSNTPNHEFYIKSKEEIQISCNNTKEWTSSIKKLNISRRLWKMNFSECIFPDTSFTQMLNNIGVEYSTAVRLDFLKNANSVFSSGYFSGLEGMGNLFIEHSSVTSLPEGFFNGLSKLESIDLDNNELTTVTSDTFPSLPSLTDLNLSHNNLTELLGGTFKNLPQLSALDINSNHLRHLTRDLFDDVNRLDILDLHSNDIQSLDDDVFQALTLLTVVDLSFNNITLPFNVMTNESSRDRTHTTQAKGSSATSSEPTYFFNSKQLKTVNLDNNNLEYLPNNLFRSEKLTNLSLKNNKIRWLDENVFGSTSKLIILDLSHNNLTSLLAPVFDSLSSLVHLHLEYNQLHFLDSKLFQKLESLSSLNLSHNCLTFMDVQLKPLIHLKTIDLSNNQLHLSSSKTGNATTVFGDCKDIEDINLSFNCVSGIDISWRINLPKLRKLDLSHNLINELNNELINFTQSVTVNLSSNQITKMDLDPTKFSGQSVSRNIILDHNTIMCDCKALNLIRYTQSNAMDKSLNLHATNLNCNGPSHLIHKSLTSVSLYDLTCELNETNVCHSSKCRCTSRPVDKTIIIDCDHAYLQKLPEPPAQMHLYSNIELIMSNNSLNSVEMLLPWLKLNITKLSLASNKLNSNSLKDFTLPPTLQVLQLHENNFTNLDKNTLHQLRNLSSLAEITLHQNPWICDCSMTDLISFLSYLHKETFSQMNQTCIQKNKISLVNLDYLCRHPSEQGLDIKFIIFGYLGIICLVIILITLLCHIYHMEIKVWMYAHKICLCLITEDEIDADKKYDAFICYSHLDESFVVEYLIPELENGDKPYRLCLHQRDWTVGELIATNIAESVEQSRRTIVLLSPNFLTSVWGRIEFRMAHLKAIQDGCARVIVILLEDIGNIDELDGELKAYLKTNTYLKWDDPRFWQKLKYALPHHHSHQTASTSDGQQKSRKS